MQGESNISTHGMAGRREAAQKIKAIYGNERRIEKSTGIPKPRNFVRFGCIAALKFVWLLVDQLSSTCVFLTAAPHLVLYLS